MDLDTIPRVVMQVMHAIRQKAIGDAAGNALFRILFDQTGWMLLEPRMAKATEGNPSCVQRSADGKLIWHQCVSGIAGILATMPGEGSEGTPPKRGQVSTTKGPSACMPRRALWTWVWNTRCWRREMHTVHDFAYDPGEYPGEVDGMRGCEAHA